MPREVKGEIDTIGYDGETLLFLEVRTAREGQWARSEVSGTAEKQHLVGRTARRFLMERHGKECPVRFDVVAIEEFSGQAPVVRLHKDAFNPRRQEGSLENPQESPERGKLNVRGARRGTTGKSF